MCDFRAYLGYATDKETGDRVDIPEVGIAYVHKNIRFGGEDSGPIYGDHGCESGVYSVCATGGFWGYYDGNDWLSCYSHPKLEFQFSEDISCHDHSQSLLTLERKSRGN